MNNKFDEELLQLSISVYPNNTNNKSNLKGWEKIEYHQNNKTGYYAEVFKKGSDIAVIYRGTELGSRKDITNDIEMLSINEPTQQKDAEETFLKIKKKFPNSKITVGGHSLGGSLAQLISAKYNCPAVTFNSFGTSKILAKQGYTNLGKMNITNYGNPKDTIFGYNFQDQPGKTFITNNTLDKNKTYILKKQFGNAVDSITNHKLEYMKNLDNAVEVKPFYFERQNTQSPLLKGSISYDVPFTREQINSMTNDEFSAYESSIMSQLKNGLIGSELKDYTGYTNPTSGDNKIFTREDIAQMTTDEYTKYEKDINSQLNSVGIPTKAELSSSSGTVFVNGYTRDDGTEVKSYYRSKPSK